jgi:hypothetical protein
MVETYPLDRAAEAYDRRMSGKAQFAVTRGVDNVNFSLTISSPEPLGNPELPGSLPVCPSSAHRLRIVPVRPWFSPEHPV